MLGVLGKAACRSWPQINIWLLHKLQVATKLLAKRRKVIFSLSSAGATWHAARPHTPLLIMRPSCCWCVPPSLGSRHSLFRPHPGSCCCCRGYLHIFPTLFLLTHFPDHSSCLTSLLSLSLCLCRLKIASILITQRIALAVSICISFSVFHLIANKMYAISKVSMCPCVSIYLRVCARVCVHGTCNWAAALRLKRQDWRLT